MDYTRCTIWKQGYGTTRPFGPLHGEPPAIRQVVECEDCGQLWLWDFTEGENWDDVVATRTIYAPIPGALREVHVGEIDAGDSENLVPRLVIKGEDVANAQRIT